MKKLIIVAVILLAITLGIILIINMKQEVGVSTVKTLTPVESFGNQMNMQGFSEYNYVLDGNWLYGVDGKHLLKRKLSADSEPEIMITIYGYGEPTAVTTYDDWIYYGIIGSEYEDDMNVDLYRIREDGSGKRKLANGGDDSGDYVLAKERIVYVNRGSIYIMNLNGTDKRKIPIANEEEGMASNLGIDNGWIYYMGEDYIYRMKPDGKKTEKVYTAGIYGYVMDKNELYCVQDDNGNVNIKYLVKKKINGKETVLATGSSSDFLHFNIEGDWIYFQEGNKVYKMKKSGKEAKQLVYKCVENEQIQGILLYDGDVLVSTNLKDIYIKKDGEVINID